MARGWPSALQTDISRQTDFIARAKSLGPVLAERAARCEEMRRVPDETIGDFRRAGFFDMHKPRRFGGVETDPIEFFDQCLSHDQQSGRVDLHACEYMGNFLP